MYSIYNGPFVWYSLLSHIVCAQPESSKYHQNRHIEKHIWLSTSLFFSVPSIVRQHTCSCFTWLSHFFLFSFSSPVAIFFFCFWKVLLISIYILLSTLLWFVVQCEFTNVAFSPFSVKILSSSSIKMSLINSAHSAQLFSKNFSSRYHASLQEFWYIISTLHLHSLRYLQQDVKIMIPELTNNKECVCLSKSGQEGTRSLKAKTCFWDVFTTVCLQENKLSVLQKKCSFLGKPDSIKYSINYFS